MTVEMVCDRVFIVAVTYELHAENVADYVTNISCVLERLQKRTYSTTRSNQGIKNNKVKSI